MSLSYIFNPFISILFDFFISKRIDMKELNCWDIRINGIYKSKIGKKIKKNRYEELKIYIKEINKHVNFHRFGIYIFTVFTPKLKSPIPQNCWDIRIYGIYKSKI